METSEATLSRTSMGAQATGDKVADTVNDAASKAKPAVDRMAAMAHDAVDKAKPSVDRMAAMAHDAVDRAAAVAAPAAEWVSTQGRDLAEMERKFVNDACQYVSANPLKSIAIALAAGFVLSRIVRS